MFLVLFCILCSLLQEKLFPTELNMGALEGFGSPNRHLLVREAFHCHLKLVRMATAKSVHELFVQDCPLEEKKEMVFLTATFTVTVALAAPEGEQVKSPESDRASCVTYQYYTYLHCVRNISRLMKN